MKILMCEPTYFEISYKINPWMLIGQSVHDRAVAQWQRLCELIQQCGAEIVLIEPVAGLPDMVFTANAALVIDQRILLSHFKHPERQGERDYYQQWFQNQGFEIIDDPEPTPTFEGAGDGLFLGETLFAAYGFRSDLAYYDKLAKFGIDQTVYCELVDPHFYHIDTCFCPLDDETALWWPGAFSRESQQRMQQHGNLIAVSQAEADKFACNAVVINNNIIFPSGCEQVMEMCANRGFNVFACEMSEYLKSGGACKCLTLVIES